MGVIRTNLADGIVCDIVLPKQPATKLAVLAPGMPSNSNKRSWMHQLAKRGFASVLLRYRGTWESTGTFLDHDPTEDVLDIIKALKHPFTDVWTGESHNIDPQYTLVIGNSFGGAAAILATASDLVDKALAIAPVVDWTAPSESEPMDQLEHVVQTGYAGAYRFTHDNWLKLSRGEFYQPVANEHKIVPSKLSIIHAHDDTVVPIAPVQAFVQRTGCQHLFLKKGGHQINRQLAKWRYRRRLIAFL